jgi:uncharacterized protein YqiB (DUF1249 family)
MIKSASKNNSTTYTTNLNGKHTKVFAPRPHSFTDLMEMYERNYIHLRLFCGDIQQLPDESVSRVAGSVPVKLTVLERSQHTTLLMLTYLFDNHTISRDVTHKKNRRPDLKIQVYHDSRQVAVVSRSCQISGKEIRLWEKQIDTVLLCRWRLNRFLYKWLHYLSYKGHDFNKNQ